MLSPSDLSSFDLDTLDSALAAAALRQDRSRRLAESIGVDAAVNPETARAVSAVDADAAATAEAHRLVSLLRRFRTDEGHAKPGGLLRRAMAILGRPNDGASR